MTYASEVLADSPYLYWKLDEPSGTAVADASGNARSGTYIGTPGTSYTLDQPPIIINVGKSVKFNTTATDGRAEINPVDGSFPTTVLSIEFWFTNVNLADVAMTHVNGSSYPSNFGIHIYFPNGTQINPSLAGTAGPTYNHGAGTLFDGTRHHFVLTWKSSDGEMKTYIDGVLRDTRTFAAGNSLPAGGSFGAGTNYSDIGTVPGTNVWDGKLDHVALYNTVLSPARVAAHYAAGSVPENYLAMLIVDSPDLHWRLGEAAGTTATDETGSNDGTYAGDFVLGESGLVDDADDAVSFNASDPNGDGRVELSTYTPPAAPITVECWYKGTALRTVWSFATSTGDAAKQFMLEHVTESGRKKLRLHRGAASAAWAVDPAVEGTSVLEDGSPHHIVILWSSVTNEAGLVIDGIPFGKAVLSGSTLAALTGTLMLAVAQTDDGVVDTAGGVSSDGVFDEFAVYPTELPL